MFSALYMYSRHCIHEMQAAAAASFLLLFRVLCLCQSLVPFPCTHNPAIRMHCSQALLTPLGVDAAMIQHVGYIITRIGGCNSFG